MAYDHIKFYPIVYKSSNKYTNKYVLHTYCCIIRLKTVKKKPIRADPAPPQIKKKLENSTTKNNKYFYCQRKCGNLFSRNILGAVNLNKTLQFQEKCNDSLFSCGPGGYEPYGGGVVAGSRPDIKAEIQAKFVD